MKKLKFKINDKQYFAKPGETVLDVALREKIEIPHLCKHPDLSIKGNCRVCLVEVKGMGLVTSCSTKVEGGMEVLTEDENVIRTRRANLELIFAEHVEKCETCIYQDNCIILKYAKEYDLKISRFEERKMHYPIWQFGDSIQFDASKCIDCRNCVEVCKKNQTCDFFEVAQRGVETTVKPKGKPKDELNEKDLDLLKNNPDKFDCTYCGQCVVHCPVGAISGVSHWQEVDKLLANRKDKVLVSQIAPSIRVSIGEEFNQKPGKIVTGQLAASMKKLGFDYAFDVNLGADITTYEEAQELIHWLTSDKPKPMFTSCCPGWVKFVEFYYPEFLSHLTTTKSPVMCSGPIIKTYFADFLKKDPRDIVVVSIMPCTAKKHEAGLSRHDIDLGLCLDRLDLKNIEQVCKNREELKGTKVPSVDHVITTREYAYLLHKHKIDLPSLKPQDLDKPLGVYSGAAAIYGATGGVMESALRSADYMFRVLDETGSLKSVVNGENYKLKKSRVLGTKISQSRIEFKEARGMQGIKEATVKLAGRKVKIAVVNGLGNARKVLDNLRAGKVEYDYVEVMACPGGCIGGGGQPVPTNSKIRVKRVAALYEIGKNLPIHTAHENPSVLEIYKKYFKGDKKLIEDILHSGFETTDKEGYSIL
ncbi:MAG: [FeFe] hydrogenase, group A [Patescibacteria group bacterium]